MQVLSDWIATHKSYVMWFQAAHHLTKGTGFAGDHQNLYGVIYEEAEDSFDAIVERVLGLTNDENVACPSHIALNTVGKLNSLTSPSNQPPLAIAAAALELNKTYLSYLSDFLHNGKVNGLISVGTEDFIAGLCNTLETYNYKLQQRVKETIGIDVTSL